jgi:hypothetical protein
MFITKLLYPILWLSLSFSFLLPPLWSIGHPWNALFHFSFLILRQSLWLLHGVQSVARPLPTTQTQNKRKQTSMPWVGFKPTIPVFYRTKTVHALYWAALCSATCYVMWRILLCCQLYYLIIIIDVYPDIWNYWGSVFLKIFFSEQKDYAFTKIVFSIDAMLTISVWYNCMKFVGYYKELYASN